MKTILLIICSVLVAVDFCIKQAQGQLVTEINVATSVLWWIVYTYFIYGAPDAGSEH